MYLSFSLYIKVLDISEKTSNNKHLIKQFIDFVENSKWKIASNCLTQEPPGLNPDWFGEIKLVSIKRVNISL